MNIIAVTGRCQTNKQIQSHKNRHTFWQKNKRTYSQVDAQEDLQKDTCTGQKKIKTKTKTKKPQTNKEKEKRGLLLCYC